MNEKVLLDYFKGDADSEQLASDVDGSQVKTSFDTITVYVNRIEEPGIFIIERRHLVSLCDAALIGELKLDHINTIAFAIISSEYFTYDKQDTILEGVLYDWDNPEIGYRLTEENIIKWRVLLQTEENLFDANELIFKRSDHILARRLKFSFITLE